MKKFVGIASVLIVFIYALEGLIFAAMKDYCRKHIVFYGSVQGVGFRYRARQAADMVGCTGWVRNEWDGSVSMEIQGTESEIDQVIMAIERGHYVRIENMDVKELEPVEDEYGFRTY